MMARLRNLSLAMSLLALAGSGGGTGDTAYNEGGIGGTGVVVVGRVQDPGATVAAAAIVGTSVQVKGITFQTGDQTVFSGEIGSLAEIEPDMVVTVAGRIDAGGTSGVADAISFSDELEAVVTDVSLVDSGTCTGAMDVMGQTVLLDAQTVMVGGFTNECPAGGELIEVSGFSAGDGVIHATRVELKNLTPEAAQEVEIKGVVNGLTASNFMLGRLMVDYSEATLPQTTWGDGTLVEVKGTVGGFTPGETPSLPATEVEIEDGGDTLYGEDGDRLEIEGAVTTGLGLAEEFAGDPRQGEIFKLNGQPVYLTPGTSYSGGTRDDILPGVRLEAEGVRRDGVLEAEQIEFEG